jgi:hypothetical protein
MFTYLKFCLDFIHQCKKLDNYLCDMIEILVVYI